ncbi:MAG: ArsC family reductase [Hyphomicrobiaceae bacterium]
MSLTLYGIPNCDTVKKARTWLDANGIGYVFHDYKKAGISADKLEHWCEVLGWEAVLNRSGTTFRKLPDAAKANLDSTKAIRLMIEQPSVIRRPIVAHPDGLLVGFNTAQWEQTLGR